MDTSCHSFHVTVSARLVLVPVITDVLYECFSFCSTVRLVVTTVTACITSDDGTTSISGTG